MEAYFQGLGAYLVEIRGESECQSQLAEICDGRTNYRMQPQLTIAGKDVRVQVDGKTIGRLEEDYAAGYVKQLATTPYLKATVCCEAIIVGGGNPSATYRAFLGVKLDLPPNIPPLDIIEGGPV